MLNKYVILIVTFLLILSKGVSAETEREAIVNHTQNATWAYYTDDTNLTNVSSNSRWYISPISSVTVRTDAYSLGPISNGLPGWWTVGTGVATFDSSFSNISVAPNLDNDPSNTFFDVGQGLLVTNPSIHSDRQKLQGKTHPIEWYFFQAPNRLWYIVNAPGYGTGLQVLKFAGTNGQYVWPPVDVSGYSYTTIPDPNGNFLTIKFVSNGSQSPFLSFPLSGYTPYTVPIIAVVDHAMTTGGGCADDIVVAYTGEKGLSQYGTSYWNSASENPSVCPSNILYGFKNSTTRTAFSINGQYNSPDPYGNNLFLFYDGHTGYDYPVKNGTEVHAAADGTATYDYSSPVGFGVKIASTSGYDTYYLHLSERSISNGQSVSKGMIIGKTGSGHLHFTVKKGAQRADPYGWRGDPGTDPLKVDGKDNVCLWETCQ